MEKIIDVTDIILTFNRIITAASPNVELFAQDPDIKKHYSFEEFTENWLQSCWEQLVEAALRKHGLIFLEVYDGGADIEMSGRICLPDQLPTHRIECVPAINKLTCVIDGMKVPKQGSYPFGRFVSVNQGWYFNKGPYDFVVLPVNDTISIVPIGNVKFILVDIEEPRKGDYARDKTEKTKGDP